MSAHDETIRPRSALLTLLVDDRVIATIGRDDVPTEVRPAVRLQPTDRTLQFRDETEATRSFDITSFSNLVFLYCSKQPHTLVASSYLDDAPPVLGEADPAAVARFESKLPPCGACDGSFGYRNPFRCPHCVEPFIDFHRFPDERGREYYGNHLYGSTPQQWEPPRD